MKPNPNITLLAAFSLVASGIAKSQQAAQPGRKRRIGGAPGDVRPQHRGTAAGTRVVGPEELPPRQRRQQKSVRSGRRIGGACPGEQRWHHRLQCLGGGHLVWTSLLSICVFPTPKCSVLCQAQQGRFAMHRRDLWRCCTSQTTAKVLVAACLFVFPLRY